MADRCPTCGGPVRQAGSMPSGSGDMRMLGKPCNNYAFHSGASVAVPVNHPDSQVLPLKTVRHRIGKGKP